MSSTQSPARVSSPVVVTALVDLQRRSAPGRISRARTIEEYLELSPEVLALQLPLVVFTEPSLVDRIAHQRRDLAPDQMSVVVPYEPHAQWRSDVDRLTRWLLAARPLCSSDVRKDTPEYLAFGWSKPHCLRRASSLIEAPWYWWLDIGLAHTSRIPADLPDRLRRASTDRSVDGRPSPSVHLVALDREGWHANEDNRRITRQFAERADGRWWFHGAQLVVGGVIGVRRDALDQFEDRVRDAMVDAAEKTAAVTDEMLLTRMLVQHPADVRTSSGAYSDLFTGLAHRPRLADLCPSLSFVELPTAERADRAAFNPSIAADPDGGFRMILRQANYRYEDGRYITLDDSNDIITDNALVRLDDDLRVTSVMPIDDSAVRSDPPLFPVHGLEDMRLFSHRGRWYVSATSREHRSDGLCEIVVAEFDPDEPATITSARRLPPLRKWRHEKNWAPIAFDVVNVDGPMRFLWSTDPATVVRLDDATGSMVLETSLPLDLGNEESRGGSQAIPVTGGWLTVVHRAVQDERRHRVYEHRFILYDAQFRILARSPWFVFVSEGIEFCAGLAQTNDGVVLSYGLEDREAWLARIDWTDLRRLMTMSGPETER